MSFTTKGCVADYLNSEELLVDRLALQYTLDLINTVIEFNPEYQFVHHAVEMA